MKHTNQNFNNQKLIYKKANNMMVFSITDHTNDTWDIETYNNLIIKFVQFDSKTNNANIYIPIYVDANEFRAVCASILSGTFSKINFGSKNDNKGTFISYGGSKNGGLAKRRVNGQLVPIITNKPEARWLIMSFGTDGYFYVKGQVYEGSVAYGGAITKQGKPVAELFFKLTQEDVLVMAQTVVSYLQAKETLALSTWQRLDVNREVWAVSEDETAYTSLEEAMAVVEERINRVAQTRQADSTPVPDGMVRLHYRRFDDDYEGWGLHIWGEGYDGPEVMWTDPVPISGFDDYGAYWDIPYKEGVGDLNFIIHKGDLKDPQPDRAYPDPDVNREVWAVSGDETAYTSIEEAMGAAGNKIIKALITDRNEIIVEFRNEINQAIFVRDGYNYVPVARLDISNSPLYTITTREELDLTKTYKIECGPLTTYTALSPELIDEIYAYDGELGTLYSKDSTTFKLWAPLASRVELHLYKEWDSQEAYRVVEMEKGPQGVWSTTVTGDMAGILYQYLVTNDGKERLVLDPYARSMAAFDSNGPDKVGKAAIVDLSRTNPAGWEDDTYVEVEDQVDVIIYEMSVRDFTISADSGVPEEKRGTYIGFIEKIPHLVDLGITHVQLMPVLNFYYGNEMDRSFENKGSAGEANYNWGYDPHNYFTPEGWYSLDPTDPHLRIEELKTLIKALHDAGIGVLLDVVYNHTAITSTFEDIVPNYYYRRNPDGSFSSGSGCGNDTASERHMMCKLIIDSVTYWVDEYHVDGFRFDLMGLHDEMTMVQVAEAIKELNPDAVLLGEGWNMETPLPVADRYIKGDNNTGHRSLLKYDNVAAVFSDTIRDGIIQPSAFSPVEEGGFVQGVKGNEIKIRTGVIASMVDYRSSLPLLTAPYDRFADDPAEVVNYVTCHDGRTLWDKLTFSAAEASVEERMRMHKLATAIVMTSQGRAFIHGGSEMLRSKPDPDNPDYGIDHNSYDSGDLTNQIVWSNKDKYRDIYEYFKGLIRLRKEHEAFRMETMEEIQKGVEFIPVREDNLVAFRLNEQDGTEEWNEIIVIYNSNRFPVSIDIKGIDSSWQVVVDGNRAGVEPLKDTGVIIIRDKIIVPPISAVVIHN